MPQNVPKSCRITVNAKIMGLISSLESFSAIFMSYSCTGSESKEKIARFGHFFLIMRIIYIWSYRQQNTLMNNYSAKMSLVPDG